jgi:hypothetical protein
MSLYNSSHNKVRLHLTNVAGIGASQLLESLLPALERDVRVTVDRIELPDRGKLAAYRSSNPATQVEIYRRWLPNELSRLLECTILAGRFDGDSPLLVLGDMPLRCRGQQTVFVQQSNLLRPTRIKWQPWMLKYAIARLIFRLNLKKVHAFIVQTDVMREALVNTYPSLAGRVHVVAQPVPSWLMHREIRRNGRVGSNASGLDLIYPAARYPHKNHKLLAKIDSEVYCPVSRLTLTINAIDNPAAHLPWVECCGFLSSQAMVEAYSRVDALLFLSKEESYGFPLVEAMFVGLPIICPNLPYARTLCGDKAIYFNPDDVNSLQSAIQELQSRLSNGWWPDWESSLIKMPLNWAAVASQMLEIACDKRTFQ